MTTSRARALVSLAATIILTAALGGCATSSPRQAPASASVHTIRFDNDGRDHVHVYLVGERREWLLGRVEPGARGMLRIPAAAYTEPPGFVRLAVIAGGRVTQRARDARAELSMAQPISAILSQEWRVTQGRLTSLPTSPAVPGRW